MYSMFMKNIFCLLALAKLSPVFGEKKIIIENSVQDMEERPAICKWPSSNHIPKNGYLACRWSYEFGESDCKIGCDKGYTFVAGDVKFLKCGYDTNLTWVPSILNQKGESENFPECMKTHASFPAVEFDVEWYLNFFDLGCYALKYSEASPRSDIEASMRTSLKKYFVKDTYADIVFDMKCSTTEEGWLKLSQNVKILVSEGYQKAKQCDGKKCYDFSFDLMTEALNSLQHIKDDLIKGDIDSVSLSNYAFAELDKFSFDQKNTTLQCYQGQAMTWNNICAYCNPGYYSNDERSCRPCPIGQYNPDSGASYCQKCDPQMTTKEEGSTNQADCSISLE